MKFSHLHTHTQYSLLDGFSNIEKMFKKAAEEGMPAVAITDHGNMFGAFEFVSTANKYNVKPIVGCEFYVVADRFQKNFSKTQKDNRYHQLMLAKDQEGYQNLSRLCSLGWIEGLYSKWPRIDKALIEKHHKGLIATTCCLGAEIPQLILANELEKAQTAFEWWLDLFGEDYYIELQRHKLPEQEKVNAVLLKYAEKYQVKIIASNDSHYLDVDDALPHDILLCVNTGEKLSTPKATAEEGGKGTRFGFPNNEFYFKKSSEMIELFADLPQAIDNTNEIVDKITPPKLQRDILLPNYPLPEGFTSLDDYLKHKSFEGAKKRYIDISPEIEERLNYELGIIRTMGFAGYFLIVQDFIAAGREMGVFVGPGRGSAAGSAVAYCIGITNIDPIKYALLFERFLNPERVTMPDVDIDFDDEGRAKVIDYVINKYGKNQVAQIITFGAMKAKSAIKDVSRVLDIPLPESNRLAGLIDDREHKTLEKALKDNPRLKEAYETGSKSSVEVLKLAAKMEFSIRGSGIHAAGVIIAPEDLVNLIPLCTAKDSDLTVTQFEGKYVESAGMLKMDFLGLATLTIIRNTIEEIKISKGITIVQDEIPLDDKLTYELYQQGNTVGTFQFESDGMRKYLQELKPTNIEDLIAMNALYRPGPMKFIPDFVRRKHGLDPIEYPHSLLEGILKYTYGIMVYQEQIMQTAQILAGYSLGMSDLLRRAMGKKDAEKMAKEREKFIKGALELHEIPEEQSSKVFDIMQKFAEYGFNRSHAAAYTVLAFHTAYLKAHYPEEYMAAVLNNNIGKIEKLTFFIDECKAMGIKVLGPDINESRLQYSVAGIGVIRFGLSAIKGNGQAASEAIVEEREKNGPFKDLEDFLSRVNLKAVNKKSLESMILAGAFDNFGYHRAQYFIQEGNAGTVLDKLMRFAQTLQQSKESAQVSLFGDAFGSAGSQSLSSLRIPDCEEWPPLTKLKKEYEVVGFYLSGHPLDSYGYAFPILCNSNLAEWNEEREGDILFAGIIESRVDRTTKKGDPFLIFTISDYEGTREFMLNSKMYVSFQQFIQPGLMVLVRGQFRPRWSDPSQKEFNFTHIWQLSEAVEKYVKGLRIGIDIEQLENPMLLPTLLALFNEHTGKHNLYIDIGSETEQVSPVPLTAKIRVNIEAELIKKVKELNGVIKSHRLVGNLKD